MGRNPAWTREEDQLLRELIAEKAAPQEMVAELKRSRDAISHRVRNLGLKRFIGKMPDVDRRAWILEMLGRGWSVREMARATNRTTRTILECLKLMVRDGLVKRTGTNTNTVRFIVIPYNDKPT